MYRPSLENSYDENEVNQLIEDSLRAKAYLEETSNRLVQYVEELTQESDPKKLYETTLKEKR